MRVPEPIKPMVSLGCLAVAAAFAGCGEDEIRTYRAAKEPSPPPAQAGDPHAGMNMGGTAPVAPGRAADFDAPGNWEPQPRTSMREASFSVKGEGGSTADVSLIILRGAAGDILGNVNRWLAQLGRAPVTDGQLSGISEKLDTPLGDGVAFDLEGLAEGGDAAKDGRILAAIVSRPGETWFFKMRGNADLAKAEKGRFMEWVRSARLAAGGSQPEPGAPSPSPAAPEKSGD